MKKLITTCLNPLNFLVFGIFILNNTASAQLISDPIHQVTVGPGSTDINVNTNASLVVTEIISGPINQTLIGPGQMEFDFNGDAQTDFIFDILYLSAGSNAARVKPQGGSEILDNSTYGYPDVFDFEEEMTGFFHGNLGVLGTFNSAGQFRGMGDKYLGIKINAGGQKLHGWVLLNCSFNRDTLTIISFGYSTTPDEPVTAGQTTTATLVNTTLSAENIIVYPNPGITQLTISNISVPTAYWVMDAKGTVVQTGTTRGLVDVSALSAGLYFLRLRLNGQELIKKIIVQH